MTNQSIADGKRFVKSFASTVIALFVIVTIFASVVFAADGSEATKVKVISDTNEITVTTTETEPIGILTTAGITLEDTDKLDLSAYVQGEGGVITVKKQKNIYIEQDNQINSKAVYASTVAEALKETETTVKVNEMVNYNLEEPIQEGMIIKVKPPITVTLKADGKKKRYTLVEGTVADLLKKANVTLDEDDYTKPSLNSELKAKMTVKVNRVTYKTKTAVKRIKFTTKTIEDEDLDYGLTEVVTEGEYGKKRVTYKVRYVNGKKKKATKIAQETISEPVQQVVKVGTKKADGATFEPNGVTSMGGYTVGQEISGRYTHYCACATCNGNSRGITSSGKRISNGMENPYYIACNWLPLGTVINVDGTLYTVVDRGGRGLSAQGRIDIFTPEGHAACYRLGVGSCKIIIVRLGW